MGSQIFARLFVFVLLFALPLLLCAQNVVSKPRTVSGIRYTDQDSNYTVQFRFRMQSQGYAQTFSGRDLNISTTEARVRRLRMRVEGFLLDPRLNYIVQLSFSRNDMDIVDAVAPNIICDAVISYDIKNWWRMGFGQTKLPGNRERLISSGNLQFAERSIANNRFTLDRDFGWFNTFRIGQPLFIKLALTSGEGRNALKGDNGLCYTGRLEWIVLGRFLKGGDYSEGDIEHHVKPAMSIGVSGSYNHKASRTGGQLGQFLQTPTDIRTINADMMFKYQGWGMLGEWFYRNSTGILQSVLPVNQPFVYSGNGYNLQASKMLNQKDELAMRYTLVNPSVKLKKYEVRNEMLMLGYNRYLSGHRIKIQTNVFYQYLNGNLNISQKGNFWGAYFQIEAGI